MGQDIGEGSQASLCLYWGVETLDQRHYSLVSLFGSEFTAQGAGDGSLRFKKKGAGGERSKGEAHTLSHSCQAGRAKGTPGSP